MTTAIIPPLTLAGDGYTILIAPEAAQLRDSLLLRSRAITTVSDDASCNLAREHMKGLAAFLSHLEKSRKEVKAPVVTLGKDIDARAAECAATVLAEQQRLNSFITAYAAEQARLQREAAEAAHRAAMEVQRKAFEEERAKLAEERAKLAAEQAKLAAERAAAEANNKKQRLAAAKLEEEARLQQQQQADAARLVEEAAAAREEALWQQEQEAQKAVYAVPVPPAGVKPAWDFQITDVSAFAAAVPNLCEIVVKRRETLAWIKSAKEYDVSLDHIPGIRITEYFTVSTR